MSLLAVALSCASAFAQSSKPVTIEGGADASGQIYEWVVTNNSGAPITSIEFPHYRANLFFAPDGWEVDCTNLTNVGVADAAGVCRAQTSKTGAAIAPGDSKSFRMQMAARASVSGRATVTVRRADGATFQVPGVSVPQKEAVTDRYLPAIGLGVVAALFLSFRALARRKTAARKLS